MLKAWLWTVVKKKKHIPYTDANGVSEKNLGIIHKLIRKMVYRRSHAFLAVGKAGIEFHKSFDIPSDRIFVSPYAIDNTYYKLSRNVQKRYDVMFSGQFIARKMPLFFVDVARTISEKRGQCRVLIIGSGPLEQEVLSSLKNSNIEYDYPGFVQPPDLPSYYASARILLFPTLRDGWGVVANEACAVGVPVITCSNAGAANDLIIHNFNGYILPLSVGTWAEYAMELLENEEKYDSLSRNALEHVQKFDFASAAQGILDAAEYALEGESRSARLQLRDLNKTRI
jgi:glycosyltransferase involved in cell wall biosynthesis